MPFDSKEQRRIMGMFATGVTVVTTRIGDEVFGMTANAVTSLSLNPPLVLFAVGKHGTAYGYFSRCESFAINILRADQEPLSNRFAMPGPKDFQGLEIRTATTGSPILADTMGYLDCRRHSVLPGGDHDIFVGEIVAGEAFGGDPLLYFQGRYARVTERVAEDR